MLIAIHADELTERRGEFQLSDGTWNLSTQWPIALLPVRLETRFLGTDLCIRVIPDVIHADTHEPELTAAELAAGQLY